MENENATKNIIYGNNYENRYARFLPVCSSISDRASIASILDYLKETPHFRKFNRVAYAYRVDEMPIVFITEKKNVESQYFEGCHSDETIEGSGEKLLHLLQKFNIRNVLIAVLIEQYHPLLPFETTNYRAIVQNSRMLLDELYKKVVHFHEQATMANPNDLLLSEQKVFKTKKIDISEQLTLPEPKRPFPKERPNYIYGSKDEPRPSFATRKNKKPSEINQQELAFLWDRCRVMKQQFCKIAQTITDRQIEQMKYFVMYDKNATINIVIRMLLIYLGIPKDKLIDEYDFNELKKQELEVLPKQKLRKLDEILKTNKKLSVDTVININRGLGMLFSLLELRIRFTKNIERITKLLENTDDLGITSHVSRESKIPVRIDSVMG